MDNTPDNTEKKLIHFPDAKAHMLFWPIVVVGVVADLWTKSAVFQWLETLPHKEYVFIDGFFAFIIRLNHGAAFSIASGKTTMLVMFSVIAFVAVIGIFFFSGIKQRLMQVGLAMFTAGILGNLYDRVKEGAVRDFIDVTIPLIDYRWPTFNIADSLLCIAVVLMMIANFKSSASQKPAHQQK